MPTYTVECPTCGDTREVFRTLEGHGKWPLCHDQMMRQVVKAPQIVSDIKPYQAMGVDVATGKAPVIRSRREHQEYLRRNNYIEVGNEKPRSRKPVEIDDPRPDLARTIEQLRSKH